MKTPTVPRLLVTLASLAAAGPGLAAEPAEGERAPRPLRARLRHYVHEDVRFEGGFTGIAQDTSDHRVDGDLGASIDLLLHAPIGEGELTFYVESSSSPWERRVAARIPEANADSGSALESDGDARVQISELRYRHPLGGGDLSFGLLDATAFLDTSELANDETSQFLANPLVNNPVVFFPDYTLGVAWQLAPEDSTSGLTLVVARSHGLADDDPSYSSLFDDDVPDTDGDGREDDKGWFGAAELELALPCATARLGVWTSTGDFAPVDGTGSAEDAYGVYGVLDGELDDTLHTSLDGALWSVRAGWADGDVSPGEAFLSGAVEVPFDPLAVGLGVAHTFASDDLGPGRADTTVAELYARFDLTDTVHVTPSIQYIRNSGLTDADPTRDDSLYVFGLRLQIDF